MKSFLVGVGLGFGVGLLLAPAAGSETRKKVKETVNDLTTQARESARPLVNAVRDQAQKLSQTDQTHGIREDSGVEGEDSGNAELLEILNSASKTKLMSVSGIGDATARRIIEGRPYTSAESVVGNGILSEDLMAKLEKTMMTEKEGVAS